MKGLFVGVCLSLLLPSTAMAGDLAFSEATEACLECHVLIHPGIVEGWKKSRHAVVIPGEAMNVKGLARKVSGQSIPEELKNQAVGCAECHTLRPEAHADTFEHNGYEVHVVVSPGDCAICHTQEAQQFDKNLMAHAYGNLMNNEAYKLLIDSINSRPVSREGKVVLEPSNAATAEEACLYCHGTRLQYKGTVMRETDQGEMEFPIIEGWPNQGTGRINLDGSLGACSACHTRHQFSIEMARKPYTCKECHVGPDVPAFKVYEASKHGNLFSTHSKDWRFSPVPWTIGRDFGAPTCAACHISLLVNTDGDLVVERTHEVKNRLPFRIFGLIYAHPHPRDADTTIIRNKDGLPLPTDFGGGFASQYLVSEKERDKTKEAMQAACLSCHGRSWVEGHWSRFENTIHETNASTLTTTHLMGEAWRHKYATGLDGGASPFDEFIERVWTDGWLFYCSSIRFTSAMAGGGDYGVFADGRYHMSKNVQEMRDWLNERMRETK